MISTIEETTNVSCSGLNILTTTLLRVVIYEHIAGCFVGHPGCKGEMLTAETLTQDENRVQDKMLEVVTG